MGLLDKAQNLKKKPLKVGVTSNKSASTIPRPKATTRSIPKSPPPTPKANYTTILDDILSYVKQQGNVPLLQLSQNFKLSQTEMEQWIKLLDEQNLLVLYYPIAGRASVRSKEYNPLKNLVPTVADPNQKKKIINMLLAGILIFAIIMLIYILYKNYIAQ
jgi:hypothetical protein